MYKKVLLGAVSGLCALVLLAGCGNAGPASMAETGAAAADEYYAEPALAMDDEAGGMDAVESPAAGGQATGSVNMTMPGDDRKVIMTARMGLETYLYSETVTALQAAITGHGGYISGSSLLGAEEGRRSAQFEARIPAERYTAFMQAAEGTGRVYDRSEESADVTSQYVDTQARLVSLRAQEERLLELMAEARDLGTLLEIQDQVTDVQYRIESYEAQLRGIDGRVAYSTVTITVRELMEVDEEEEEEPEDSFGTQLGAAFTGGWKAALGFGQGLLLVAAAGLPVILLLALAGAVALVVWRRKRRAGGRGAAPQPVQKPDGPGEQGK